MWQPSVLETYGNLTTTYLNKTKGPLRPNYPNTMGDRELISSLTKVGWSSTSQIRTKSFITGPRVLQRLRKGHRHCEHLLRGTHRLWRVAPQFQPTENSNEIYFPEFERLPKMTWLDFISGFGGLCGLCLGISFVSVAEILYWFSIRLCKNL